MTIKYVNNMNDSELLYRAEQERSSVFARYDLGRKNGAKIDVWEDSEFKIYQRTDKYGFIHDDNENQNKLLNTPTDRIQMRVQQEREKKWSKMTQRWQTNVNANEKLRKRVFKGIPDTYRSLAWMKLLNLKEIKERNAGIYEKFLKIARDWSTEAKQIDSDVNRQFRDHIDFCQRYSIKQISLFRVLIAYSMYNMGVGYCQGMAGVAGILLMYMDEEDAFWALNELLTNRKYGMYGFFILGFPKLIRFTNHHDKILTKLLPKLKKHLDSKGLDSILYSLKWFFVVFVERVPFDLCLRIWDIYLLEGERVLVAMAYTILRLHKQKILRLKEMDAITTYLQTTLYNDFGYDTDYVIRVLEQSMEELRRSKLDLPAPLENDELSNIDDILGKFIEPANEQKFGLRPTVFSETEKNVTENVLERREKLAVAREQDNSNSIYGNDMDEDEDDIAEIRQGGRHKLYQSSHSITTSMATSFCSEDDIDEEEMVEAYAEGDVIASQCDNDDDEDDDRDQITHL